MKGCGFVKGFVARMRLAAVAGCLVVAMVSPTAFAMPTKSQIAKAEKLVSEIMQSDVAAFKAKSKTAADVASAALGYADEAQDEAAKYVLLKGAFQFQVRAADYDGAKDTIGRIRADIADVPDKIVADMLAAALRRVPRKHCGQLYDLLQRMQNRVRYAQELQTLAQKVKSAPSDHVAQARIGELHALLGNWEQAVASFAAVGGGKRAEVATWEMTYPKADKKFDETAVADFWWDDAANAKDEELAATCRSHASHWYRKAIENNAAQGLRKTLVEKRIAEVEKDVDVIAAPAQSRATIPVAQQISASEAAVGKGGTQPPSRTLRLGGGVDIEFVGCPAGSFMMGDPKDDSPRSAYRYHKVNITRPFWLSKFKVTHGMWNAYQKVSLTKEDNALGGMKRVHCVKVEEADAFCEWLTKRCRSSLPPKYVVRLPTEAEWEYALRANVTDPNDPYVRMFQHRRGGGDGYVYEMRADGTAWFAFPELKDFIVTLPLDVKPRLQAAGLWGSEGEAAEKGYSNDKSAGKSQGAFFGRIQGMEVGTKKPNAWGLFDMAGNKGEMVFDTVDFSHIPRAGMSFRYRDQDGLCYAEEETDPLHLALRSVQRCTNIRRGGYSAGGWWVTLSGKTFSFSTPIPFRLCIGPDLMKEKRLGK